AGEYFLKRGDLGCREACDPFRAFAGERDQFWTHNRRSASRKVVDDAVLQAIKSIAGSQDGLSREIEILVRIGFVEERLPKTIVDTLSLCDFCQSLRVRYMAEQRGLRQVESGCAGEDAIEIRWKPLRHHHRFAAALGAPHVIRSLWGTSVMSRD